MPPFLSRVGLNEALLVMPVYPDIECLSTVAHKKLIGNYHPDLIKWSTRLPTPDNGEQGG